MGSARSRTRHRFSEAFLERFRIDRVIGTGGTAIVYLAMQLELKRPVALKVLDAIGFEEEDAEGRFEDEARLAARLDHPNLCKLYEYGRDGDHRYLVYEFIDGTDLSKAIEEARSTPRKGLPVERAMSILADVARGLEYAHKLQVVHRDLKPANILLDREGRALVTDFGLAKMAGMTREIQTETGMVVGTPECMAPEQAMGKEVGTASDVYALGCLLYWMLAGRPPYRDDNVATVMLSHARETFPDLQSRRPNLGSGPYRLLQELVHKDPEDRPSATELLRALKVLERPGGVDSASVEAALTARRIKFVKPAPKPRRALWGGFLFVMVAAASGWFFWPKPLPSEFQVLAAPRHARISWVGVAGTVEVRPIDGSEPWQPFPGVEEGGRWVATPTGLTPSDDYSWRFRDPGGVPGEDFETPAVAQVKGPWPRYDERGNGVGWLLRAPEGFSISPADGVKVPTRSDGLLEVGEGVYGLHYPEGLRDEQPPLPSPPNLPTALSALIQALADLDVRRAVGSAIRAKSQGRIPTGAVRLAVGDLFGRWKGVEPALRTLIPTLSPARKLALYGALDRAGAVDRALRNEGLSAAFDVQEFQGRCLSVASDFRPPPEKVGAPPLTLVTREEYTQLSEYRYDTPPKLDLSADAGSLEVSAEVSQVWADRYLVFEVIPRSGEKSEITVRPPCRNFQFAGRIRIQLPAALAGQGGIVRLHLRAERLPGAIRKGERARFPLLKGKHAVRRPKTPALLHGWRVRRGGMR